MKKVLVIGEILVEIMADSVGDGFTSPIGLTGPFPSGAPAIYADQMAKLGQPVSILSAVGDDDFGRINLDRLDRDGVDVSGVVIDRELPTGTAFIRYREDGSRNFVFNIVHSACKRIEPAVEFNRLLESANHLHVMGSSLSSEGCLKLNMEAMELIKCNGGTVSFDPNFRSEIPSSKDVMESIGRIIEGTDLLLPSGGELTMLSEFETASGAVSDLLKRGVGAIVHKNGIDGATYYDSDGSTSIGAFSVAEVDPTGAGDCFGATFTTLWLRNAPVQDALSSAAAAGALAVTQRGPMEGTSDWVEIREFIAKSEQEGT